MEKKRRLRFLVGLLVIVATWAVACRGGLPTENAGTGIAPANIFAQFYTEHGGVTIFGFPITDSFDFEGRQVQYFSRMRLEIEPATGLVQITPLGSLLYDGIISLDVPVEDEFLTFYETYGGESFFGKPISPQLVEADRWVQYFENARLSWHPENQSARVQVGELGSVHYRQSGAVAIYREQVRIGAIPVVDAGISQLNLSALVASPILFSGDQQRLRVMATTPEGNPAVGRTVEVTALYESGESVTLPIGQTDAQGIVEKPLALPAVQPGQTIQLHIHALSSNGESIGVHGLTYKVWW